MDLWGICSEHLSVMNFLLVVTLHHDIRFFFAVLTRVYGSAELKKHDYSRTLSSLGFAGTVVGMLIFGGPDDRARNCI